MTERSDITVSISLDHDVYLAKLAEKKGLPKSKILANMIAFCERNSNFAVD